MNEDEKITEDTKHTSFARVRTREHLLALDTSRRLPSSLEEGSSHLICAAQKLLRSAAGMGDKDSSASGPSCGSGCGSGCRWWSANALTRR